MYGVGANTLFAMNKEDVISINYSIYGYTKFTDTNNITYTLPNTLVQLNSSINTTSNISGYYEFFYPLNDEYNIIASKGDAYDIKSTYIEHNNHSDSINFTLNYSKPSLTTPIIDGAFLKSTYSHNFKTISLWENPYFVWGNYVYTNASTKKECLYKGNNVFACDLLPGTYKFNMTYSDIYNYNLYLYHPTLTTNRTFSTGYIYIEDGSLSFNNTFKLNPRTRETNLNNNVYDYLFIIIIILGIVYITGFNKRRRILKVFER
jgi:hypothetical protein